MSTEARLQDRIIRAIRKEYPEAWIFHPVGGPYQVPGVPDLLICVEGRFAGLEIKNLRPGESREHALGRVTPVQRKQLRKIYAAGGIVAAVTSVLEALEELRAGLDETNAVPDEGEDDGTRNH